MNTKIAITIVAILAVAILITIGVFWYNNSPNISQKLPGQSQNITMKGVVDANNQFAMDLYNNWDSQKGNIFFSPYSISSALAMTYEGARGETATEMQNVLHIPIDQTTRTSEFSQINAQINDPNKPYLLTIANALWAQENYPFSQDYLSLIDKYYDGKATNLDFISNPEGSRQTINQWVEDKTNDKIQNLIQKGLINSYTRLVLTNAIYFKANWTLQFDATLTQNKSFMSDNGNLIIPMMEQIDNFNYAESSDMQALELPYQGNDISMLVLLPKDSISSLESSLTLSKLNKIRNALEMEKVDVSLPKFKIETDYSMSKDLSGMGMPTAFSAENADFSGMTGKQDLFISEVVHKAFINVTEQGTEAAAATAVIMGTSLSPSHYTPPKVFNADHTFIFVIQQKSTGNILFMGRVSNPSE